MQPDSNLAPAAVEKHHLGERGRAVIGILILAPFVLLGALHAPWGATQPWLKIALDTAGWLCFFAGAGLRFWATLYIGGHKGKSLVDDGPYSVTRNPLYLGIFFLVLSIAFFLGSPLITVGVLFSTFVYLRVVIASEERRLLVRWGAVYQAYCDRVPRFWPRWQHFHAGSSVEVDLRTLKFEVFRALRWGLIPIACELVRLLEAQPGWPHLW
jgi:protein-S-isoprenylcysteine O-methyltransferase Ste14